MSRAEKRESYVDRLRGIAVKLAGLGYLLTFQNEDACPGTDEWEGIAEILRTSERSYTNLVPS